MGICICKKHGHQGFREMCGHVYRDLQNKQYPEHKLLSPFNIMLCPNCWDKLKADRMPNVDMEDLDFLASEQGDIADKIFSEIYDQITDRKLMCIKCILEIRHKEL